MRKIRNFVAGRPVGCVLPDVVAETLLSVGVLSFIRMAGAVMVLQSYKQTGREFFPVECDF